MIKAIIFDCFGVLTDDSWQQFVDRLHDEYIAQQARDVHRLYDCGGISKQESYEQIKYITGKRYFELEDTPNRAVNKNIELLDYIAEIKPSFKIGLLSNVGNDWISNSFLTQIEQSLFDSIVYSYRVKLVKPDPLIFELMAKELHVTPHESVLIDDKESNCRVASNLGMRTILYRNFQGFKVELDRITNNE